MARANPTEEPDDLPSTPWGPGGFEVHVGADEEAGVIAFLRSVNAGLKERAAEHIARYGCALTHFADSGGPPDATSVGRALGLRSGAVHDLLNENKIRWSARRVQHKLAVAALRQRIDGIVISHFFTEYDPCFTIVTAHAFADAYRILIGARRARHPPGHSEHDREVGAAYQSLVAGIADLLAALDPPQTVPVLAESPFVGQAAIASLVASDLDYLAELSGSWSAGGIVPATSLPYVDEVMGPGGSLKGLFPPGGRTAENPVTCRPVVLNAWSPALGNWAMAVGGEDCERYFLGRMSGPSQLTSGSSTLLEERVTHWSQVDLSAGAWLGYGLEKYHAPKDVAFERHCAMLTLRDAFLIDRRRG